MALEVGRLVAYLDLDDSKFNDGLDQGQSKFSKFGGFVAGAAKAVGAALVAGGAVTAALGVKAIKTGIAYNALQQASRAALATLLGGAKNANAQMDKLDKFARESPFAKQVFIKAQQQLLGFGVKASRVIPTLNAIQNAVAAVGGSSDDVGQIAFVLAKIQGQGKLTGETLSDLGQYGIDAASIIGKEMGKTGAEIRKMASKPGGIPADKAFDPLVNGLNKKFAGAAANVKTTWSGATDRVKAAFRDIGAALVEPFISKNGGGLAIDWTNQLATKMREMIPLATRVSKAVASILIGLQGGPKKGPLDEWMIKGMKARAILMRVKDAIVGLFPKSGSGGVDMAATMDKITTAAKQLWPEVKSGIQQMREWSPILDLVGAALDLVSRHVDTLIKWMPTIIAAVIAFKVAQEAQRIAVLANLPVQAANTTAMFVAARANQSLATAISQQTAIQNASTITTRRSTIGWVASKVAMIAAAVASKAWAAGQWLLNAALSANPIGLVVIAIAAIVAGLILAYKHSETFRKIVKFVADAIVGYFKMMASIWLLIVSSILTGLSKLLAPLAKLPGKFGAPFRAAKSAVDSARGAVDDLRHSINETKGKNVAVTVSTPGSRKAIDDLAKIKWQLDHIPRSVTVGVNNKLMQNPGHNANGTNNWRGGLTWVGERGPELVDLPQGSKVFDNRRSVAMARGSAGGSGLHVDNVNVKAVGQQFSLRQVLTDVSHRRV